MCSYSIGAISFAPEELAGEMARKINGFKVSFQPDHRQQIADSWPAMIDDSEARMDWGLNHAFDLRSMTSDLLQAFPNL